MKRLVQNVLRALGYGLRRVQDTADISLYHSLYPEDSINNKRFYNIGAGGFLHPLWTNVDYDSGWYASNRAKTAKGIQYDLLSLEALPIGDESAEVVYSSHTVEHISNAAAQNMFNEAHRILKPGGVLRVTTPNIDLEYRAYRDNDRDFFYWIDTYSIPRNWQRAKYNKPLKEASIEQVFLAHFATSVSTLHRDGAPDRIDDHELRSLLSTMEYEEVLDYCVSKCPLDIQRRYPGNHVNWWNFRKMAAMLEEAGFARIYLSGYGQSFCPILRDVMRFDNTHPKMSLYVEAIK